MSDAPTPKEAEYPIPGDDGPEFEAPWQARAFGLAVALHEEQDHYDWQEFQQRLIEEIEGTDAETMQEAVEETYYEQFLAALERLLVETETVSDDELATRAAEFAEGDRDASEFVTGDR